MNFSFIEVKCLCVFCFLTGNCLSLSASLAESDSIPDFSGHMDLSQNVAWMEYVEELSDSETETALLENLFDELSHLSENPFNLNTVGKSDLERLPFLSDIQIENLLYYIYKYAPVQSIYELRNVDGLDMRTINYLLPFIYIGEANKPVEKTDLKKLVRYGKNELFLRADYCFQKKAGYHIPTEEELEKNSNKHYLGENYYSSFKYGFAYRNKMQFGMTGEKDAGEPFWNKHHKGFDFYSFHLVVKDMGIMKAIHIGDYKASFGQGLILNTDFVMGKSSDVININKKNTGVKRHFSTNETDYLRGVALTLTLDNCLLNLLYSHKQVDAAITENEIISIKTDGYNRTYKDMEKKNQAELNLIGGNFHWQLPSFGLGMTAIWYDFGGKTLVPTPHPYNLFYLRDANNFNVGFDYKYQRRLFFFQGETAFGKNGSLATINTVQFTPASFIAFVLSYRDYKKDYQSYYGRSFGEGSTVQNESGVYFGTNIKFLRRWSLSVYIDAFQFPWLKYGINRPSEGYDFLTQIDYRPKRYWIMTLRYKQKLKEKNYTQEKAFITSVLPYSQKKIRYQTSYQTISGFKTKFQLEYIQFTGTTGENSNGWMASQGLSYADLKFPVQVDLGMSYFHTDNWDTRISAYEKNILYAFSFPTFYGEGLRAYSVIKYPVLKNMTFYAKIAWTHYFDRDVIGSDLEQIDGKNKIDANFLLKVKF